MLDAPKQFIQTQPVASVDRGSEWIGGECDGFLSGAKAGGETTCWRRTFGAACEGARVRMLKDGQQTVVASAKRTGTCRGVDGRRRDYRVSNVATEERTS